jgi:hypothetical protein
MKMTKIQQTEPTFELINVEGRLKWLTNLGDVLPYVRGGADDDDPEGEKQKNGARTFTQDEMNQTVGEAKRRARETAQADLLKTLGVDDPEAAKALIAAAKAAEEKNATELDKASKARTEAETKAQAAEQTAAQLLLTNAIEKALIREGLSVEAAERARKLVEVDKPDPDDIKAAIASLKKDMPSIFTAQSGGMPNTNPGAPPPKGGKDGDPTSTAQSVLHERHPHLKK